MSLLEGVTYYYVDQAGFAALQDVLDNYSNQDLIDAGLTLTLDDVQALYNDFDGGTDIGGRHYVGEDHISPAELELLNILDIGSTWYVGESSQRNGAPF